MLVKATKPVIDRIHGQIEKLRDAECKREFGKTPADYLSEVSFGNDEHKVIELLFWGEHLSYRDKLPEEWFFKLEPGDTFTLMHPDCEIEYSHQVVFTAWGCNGKSINSDISSEAPAFVVKLAHKHLVPHRNQQGYHRKETHEVDNPDIHPAVRRVFDTTKAILCLVEKWQAVEQKVKTFLDSTKSVNEAVKLWPELVTFLDPEDRQRLQKEGTTKKARESRIDEARKVLAEIDTQSIVADVVGIKLSAA